MKKKNAILLAVLCATNVVLAQNRIFTIGESTLEMVPVQGGEFYMGAQSTDPNGINYDPDASPNEGPVHKVRVSDFWISKYPISQGVWWEVTQKTPHNDNCGSISNPNCNLWYPPFVHAFRYSAYYLSYNDLRLFLNQLNNNEEIQKQITFGFREGFYAPTEAQWEFAARGGNLSKGYKFAGSDNYDEVAWTSENSSQLKYFGSKKPNELGLYDMCGSLAEWCSDAYAYYDDYQLFKHPDSVMVDPTNSIGNTIAQRGGRYSRPAVHNRITTRYDSEKNVRFDYVGARIVLRAPIPQETTKLQENCAEKIQILQNPAGDILRLNGVKLGATVAIFTVDGRCVLTQKVKNENDEINISSISSGIYLLKTDSQQAKFVKK